MSTLPAFAAMKPLEQVAHYTPLGIRFWDLAEDRAIVDGLEVIARPTGQPHLTRWAFQTLSGVYAFHNLPGMRSLERSGPDSPAGIHVPDGSPPVSKQFIVEVIDHLTRFVPVSFVVNLPYYGIYPTSPQFSPPTNGLPGFFLFSDPSRPTLSNLAVVRAQLLERLAPGDFVPAQHAVLVLQPTGGPVWYGIANELGNVAVLFPYPQFAGSVGPVSPPPGPPHTRVQSWDVRVRVLYRPATQSKLDRFATHPSLGSLFAQPEAQIFPDPSGPIQLQLNSSIVLGQPLLLQTDGVSELWIRQ